MSTAEAALMIDEAEAIGRKASPGTTDFDARCRLALTIGVMSSDIRRLCEQLERLRTAEGIAEGIARLPSRHADLLTILNAAKERIEAEGNRIDRYGFDTVAEYLDEACAAMDEAGANDAEAARIEWDANRYVDETRDARSIEYWERRA